MDDEENEENYPDSQLENPREAEHSRLYTRLLRHSILSRSRLGFLSKDDLPVYKSHV